MQRFAAVAAASLVAVAWFLWDTSRSTPQGVAPEPVAAAATMPATSASFAPAEGEWVTVSGVVARTLSDDREGSRHQRFILQLDGGRTLLISHNIDLAPRLENLERGERLTLRGEYQSTARGGLVHWTHHDPDGSHPGGYIERGGRRYQ